MVGDIRGAYFHRMESLEIERPFNIPGSQLLKTLTKCVLNLSESWFPSDIIYHWRGLWFSSSFPRRGYGPELVCRGSDGHPLLGLARFGAQGGPRSATDWHAPRPCLAGEWEGRRPEWSFPLLSPLTPFQELCVLYFMVLL